MTGKSRQQELEGTGCFYCTLNQEAESEGSSMLAGTKLAFSIVEVQALRPTGRYHTPWGGLPMSVSIHDNAPQASPEVHLSDDSRSVRLTPFPPG